MKRTSLLFVVIGVFLILLIRYSSRSTRPPVEEIWPGVVVAAGGVAVVVAGVVVAAEEGVDGFWKPLNTQKTCPLPIL